MKNFVLAVVLSAFFAGTQSVRADQNKPELDVLFGLLQDELSHYQAEGVIRQIWGHWLDTDNEELSSVMDAGIDDMSNSDLKVALERFTEAIDLKPDFAEAWNKRATVYYMLGDFEKSSRDVEETLKLEPRHFGALSGQGMILLNQQKPRKALEYFKRALDMNPFMSGVIQTVRYLEEQEKNDLI
ncbi:MAG: tetratricopeptide repeat protein [Pseudomonadota bacterium]